MNALAERVQNLVGGSADLAPSTKTLLAGQRDLGLGENGGRNIHFGVREHAMGGMLNGMDEVIHEVSGSVPVVALSGPTHAEEVGRDLPASIVAAGVEEAACRSVQDAFRSKTLRVYTSSDIVGVELGGSWR